ncbi:hypothetical protein MGWOODY_Tha1810 [hydrothermal vent metagenome]|uniref:Uncharacterized protein n=1 Tax=hydrothermal vent metagenome TaxID=652676 RepID=A0A160TG69_9ZZZZ
MIFYWNKTPSLLRKWYFCALVNNWALIVLGLLPSREGLEWRQFVVSMFTFH